MPAETAVSHRPTSPSRPGHLQADDLCRMAWTTSEGPAGRSGPAARGRDGRMSRGRNMAAVVVPLRGENLDTALTMSSRRDAFLSAGGASLRARRDDGDVSGRRAAKGLVRRHAARGRGRGHGVVWPPFAQTEVEAMGGPLSSRSGDPCDVALVDQVRRAARRSVVGAVPPTHLPAGARAGSCATPLTPRRRVRSRTRDGRARRGRHAARPGATLSQGARANTDAW